MEWHQSNTFRGLGSIDTFREYAASEFCLCFGERTYIPGVSRIEVRDHSQASPLGVDVIIAVKELV